MFKSLLFLSFAIVPLSFVRAENITLSDTARWLIVGSDVTLEDAKKRADVFALEKAGVRVVRSQNGRFATVLGPFGDPDLNTLKAMKNVPSDAYLSTGTKMAETMWLPSWENKTNGEWVPVGRNSSECTTMSDPVARLRCYDRINKPDAEEVYAEDPNGPSDVQLEAQFRSQAYQSTSQATDKPARQVVAAASQRLASRRQDLDNGVWSNRIELYLSYANETSKPVVGVRHKFSVTNAFGEILVSGTDNLDVKLLPKQTAESSVHYFWEDNQFISGEPYDRLNAPVSNGTYHVTDEILKVIYADGSSQEMSGN
ncbi:hypothetical protein [Neorhizobium sp. DAR64872/K0K18]|uniref:hypothetical protein n=1 Tax=Neorhizobium sp. DAR64872/K0K18 TaxID=3421958 RepID=UPI003D297ED5